MQPLQLFLCIVRPNLVPGGHFHGGMAQIRVGHKCVTKCLVRVFSLEVSISVGCDVFWSGSHHSNFFGFTGSCISSPKFSPEKKSSSMTLKNCSCASSGVLIESVDAHDRITIANANSISWNFSVGSAILGSL